MLQIRLLGQFDVRASGKRLDIPSRAGQSLLAYLLLNAGTPQRRERLAGLLWPDTSDESARHNLRTELWRIRKALGSRDDIDNDYLLSEDLTITFNPESQFWFDVNQLQRCTTAAGALDDLIGQLTLYQGELLPGFYDDWIVLERERLQSLFERDMKRLLERLCEEQRWATVLEWSERWIALGQTPEPAYRALMAAYAALGDRAKAVATFERCRAALEHDLGVEPSPETQNLYDRLLRGEAITSVDLSATQIAPVHAHLIEQPPAPGEPPFKGLQYFDEADADLFFGREALTAKLIEHLHQSNFLAVIVGASGSGKSSIVRAGLIPALKREQPQWLVNIITPTAHPLEALATALTRDSESVTATATLLDDLAREPRSLALFSKRWLRTHDASRVLLVIDQFEELFTLCRDEFEREAFIDNLLTALLPSPSIGRGAGGEGCVTLILTLRADFYAHLAQYPELREAVAKQQEYIGPMTADELRRAIEEPAKHGGWEFEPGLVDLMLRDVGDEPGALPLLSHALLETWQRRSGHSMTLKGYADAGGVRGAIAYTAESVYQQLTPEQQTLTRHIFLELTELGEGTEDTRRRVKIEELIAQSDQARPLLTTLADARLITTGEETVEVAHEALIREWPRLRDWLNEDREGLQLHRHLSEAAHDWELLEHDPGALYRGARLSQANEWAATNEESLSAAQRAFLAASNELEQREAAEREAQRQRELRAALTLAETQQQAAIRMRRRNRVIIGAGLVALLLAVLAGLFGAQANQNAALADQNAARVQVEAQTRATAEAIAVQQREEALRQASIGLAAQAEAELQGTAPERGVLLALEALENYPYSPQAESALAQAVGESTRYYDLESSGYQGLYANYQLPYNGVWSPDGRWFATSLNVDGWIAVWDMSTVKLKSTFQSPIYQYECRATSLTWSADSKRILAIMPFAAGDCEQLQPPSIWDAASGKIVRTFDSYTTTATVGDWSKDGTFIVIGEQSGTVKIWNSATGQLRLTLSGHTQPIKDVAWSPQSDRLATASADGAAKVWNATSGAVDATLAGHAGGVTGVTWSPDGTMVATSSMDGLGRIWNMAKREIVWALPGHTAAVLDIAWSPEGDRVATTSHDNTVRIWDVETGMEIARIQAGQVFQVAWSPQGEQIAGGGNSIYRIWYVPKNFTRLAGHTDGVCDAQWTADGRRIVTSSFDATARMWDAATGKQIFKMQHPDPICYFAFSPDDKRIVTTGIGGQASIWDITTGQLITAPKLRTDPNFLYAAGWSSDGARIVGASFPDFVAPIWDVDTSQIITTVGTGRCFMHYPVWAPQGDRFMTGCVFTPETLDNTPAIIYDYDGKVLMELESHDGETVRGEWSPDGKRLAVAYENGKAKVWDAATGKELTEFAGHTTWLWDTTWSPDGKRIASADANGIVKVWDSATGEEVMKFKVPGGAVLNVDWSPDGQSVIAAGFFKTPIIKRVWQSTDELIQYAKDCCVFRELTAAEREQFGLAAK